MIVCKRFSKLYVLYFPLHWRKANRVAALFIICMLTIVDVHASAERVDLYMSPGANDTNRGHHESEPVGSLQTALELAENAARNGAKVVRILIESGLYLDQRVITRGLANRATLKIGPKTPNGGRPVFDGLNNGGTWFILRSATGLPSNVNIFGIEVANYVTAISLNGNRNEAKKSNGFNLIQNNVFRNIGQQSDPNDKPSTAAVRLVNSNNNTISGNRFYNIQNLKSCGLIHAVYVAHGSVNNTIEDNLFDDSCGDAVRFRDGSHGNAVTGNEFIDSWGKSPISDWYCDAQNRRDCSKPQQECPSLNNIIRKNTVVADRYKRPEQVLTYGANYVPGCGGDPKTNVRFVQR